MEATTQQKLMRYVAEIVHTIKSTNQYEQALHLITDRLVRLYRTQTCAVILIDPATEYLRIENSVGLSHTYCKAFRRTLAVGRIGEMLWTGKPIFIDDARREPLVAAEIRLEHEFDVCACLQIAVDHRTLGYLHVDGRYPHTFSCDDLPILQAFADMAGIAVDKARLHDENLRLDVIDHDTGLEKYTAFIRKAEAALTGARSFNEHLSLMIMDVDNYKDILGTFGYESALRCLKEMARLLRGELRCIDAAGRYGFDEFIAMLVKTDLASAVQFAQRFCRAVEGTPFVNNAIRTTVSIGVATFPQNGSTLDDLLLTARHALLEAQRAGRNSVFFYPAEWYASERALH